jgi:hypothetical protein
MFVGSVVLLMMNTTPIRMEGLRSAASTEPGSDYTQAVTLPTPLRLSQWRHIVIHSHPADSADAWKQCHFLIDQDEGGKVRVRATDLWKQQRPGRHASVPGYDYSADAIGVSLAGDFDLHAPTATQMKALGELVKKLQLTCGVDQDRVYLYRELTHSPEPGAKFPAADFHSLVLKLDR